MSPDIKVEKTKRPKSRNMLSEIKTVSVVVCNNGKVSKMIEKLDRTIVDGKTFESNKDYYLSYKDETFKCRIINSITSEKTKRIRLVVIVNLGEGEEVKTVTIDHIISEETYQSNQKYKNRFSVGNKVIYKSDSHYSTVEVVTAMGDFRQIRFKSGGTETVHTKFLITYDDIDSLINLLPNSKGV